MERVSVVRAHDLLVLSMNHVLPVTSDSRVEWGGEMQYGLWRLDNHLFSPKIYDGSKPVWSVQVDQLTKKFVEYRNYENLRV